MDGIPVYTADGTRSTKHERLLTVAQGADDLPDSFRRNNLKESLVIQYVDHFRKQFVQLYPDRPQLLLSPLNEAGVPKFVCTTVRPTQLPFREVSCWSLTTKQCAAGSMQAPTSQLYDLGACASFFAAYLHYEPLDNPVEVPPSSPFSSLYASTRVGDAFDLSTVLASYLIGSGYDAYVVSGRAPRWLTLRQEDRSVCRTETSADAVDRDVHTSVDALELRAPEGSVGSATAIAEPPPGAARYKMPLPPSLASEYQTLLQAKQKQAAEAVSESVTALGHKATGSP